MCKTHSGYNPETGLVRLLSTKDPLLLAPYKQKFDRKAHELEYEKEHKNTYMFLFRSVTRMKKSAAGSERIAAAQRALAEFCLEARRRKAQVKAGDMPERDFIG